MFKPSKPRLIKPPRPYIVKTFKNLLPQYHQPMALKHSMLHWVLVYYQDCSDDDLGLTFSYFTARSNMEKF